MFYIPFSEKEMATHSNILAWIIPQTRSLVGYSPWGHKQSDPTEWLTATTEIPFYCSRRAAAWLVSHTAWLVFPHRLAGFPTPPGWFPGAPNTLLCSSSQSLLLSLRHSYSTVFAFTYCLSLASGLVFFNLIFSPEMPFVLPFAFFNSPHKYSMSSSTLTA